MDQHAPLWHTAVAGTSATMVSRFFTYPPDTIKARLQVQGSGGAAVLYSSTLDAARKIAASEGLAGFYRGFGSILVIVLPANVCYFGGYELGKRVCPRHLGVASDMMTGAIAQTLAGLLYCPLDICKQAVQTAAVLDPTQPRLSPLGAARHVYASQGLRGLFRGYLAMTCLWLPWNALYMSLYEATKRRLYFARLRAMREAEAAEGRAGAGAAGLGGGSSGSGWGDGAGAVVVRQDPPMAAVLPLYAFPLASAACASVAAVATHPIDVVKTRLQVLSARAGREEAAARAAELRFGAVARALYAREGWRGFLRGVGARVATISTGSAVSWGVFESTKRWLAADL